MFNAQIQCLSNVLHDQPKNDPSLTELTFSVPPRPIPSTNFNNKSCQKIALYT